MPLSPLLISLQVATIATLIVFIIGLILAMWLAKADFPGKTGVELVINLPLILPPTVLGFYLLVLLGRSGPFYEMGLQLVFTKAAAVTACVVVALPLMVQSSRAAIASVDPVLERAAGTMGAPPWRVFWDITLPLARPGILAGTVLAFARSLGEFGATLMVAGNIPGRTQTLPLAIYDLVQANRLAEANIAVMLMTAVAFGLLLIVNSLSRRAAQGRKQNA